MRTATECCASPTLLSNWSENRKTVVEDDSVLMRPKKTKQQNYVRRFRPASTNSYVSLASSGMSDVRWHSPLMSSCSSTTLTSWQLFHEKPQSWKHEGYLDEEKEMIIRGLENTKKLAAWYHERLKTIEKRANLLSRGLVPIDTAVHEQRLNYLRAHIAELNRRITSLMESGDRAFPTHSNLQVRTQMPQPSDDRSHYFRRQNIQLCQELAHKDRLIELLIRERKAEMNNDSCGGAFCTPFTRRSSTSTAATPGAEHHCSQHYPGAPKPKLHGTLM